MLKCVLFTQFSPLPYSDGFDREEPRNARNEKSGFLVKAIISVRTAIIISVAKQLVFLWIFYAFQ